MTLRSVSAVALLLASSGLACAQQIAPPELRNRTVVVRYTEVREQRFVDDGGSFERRSIDIVLTANIDHAGRTVSRWDFSFVGPRGRIQQSSNTRVSGQTDSDGVTRGALFQGRSMSIIGADRSAARRFDINFSGPAGCSAQVRYARADGGSGRFVRLAANQRRIEIRNARPSNVRCEVRQGSSFAG